MNFFSIKERTKNEELSKIFDIVYPCPSHKTRSHIIPLTLTINALFNKLLQTSVGQETLVKMLRDLYDHLTYRFENKHLPGTSDEQTKMRMELNKTERAIDYFSECMKNEEDHPKQNCTDLMTNIHFLFEWHPGNLFLSPINLILDNDKYQGEYASRIFPIYTHSLIRKYNDDIINFLESGNDELLDNILPQHRKLLSVSDKMYNFSTTTPNIIFTDKKLYDMVNRRIEFIDHTVNTLTSFLNEHRHELKSKIIFKFKHTK